MKNRTRISCTPTTQKSLDIQDAFNEWKSHPRLSSVTRIASDPVYQRIIGMGEKAVPLILRELQKEPDHWFLALHYITGADPVKSDHRGVLKLMAEDWIEWGRRHGFINVKPKS